MERQKTNFPDDPEWREHRVRASTAGRYRAGIDGLIKRLEVRIDYATDEQRRRLIELATGLSDGNSA